ILKNVIVEDALKVDPILIKLLLSDKTIKKHFFQDVEGIYVFDKIKFQKFISNKQFLPDSYTAFKNKIGLTANDEYISEKKDVVLCWPYKDCILEGGQDNEDAKRDEIFWNETLAPDETDRLLSPKVLTKWKKYDKDGEHTVNEFSKNDNLIIKGNNLLGLCSILKKYRGKVKLIYIDIPYFFSDKKEGDTFQYNTNFKLSTWLTFHKDRLGYAKHMLSESGVIFIHSNDDSQAYLKVICDNIFGISNYVNTIAVNLKNIAGASGGGEDKKFKKNIEYIHIYAKNYETLPTFNSLYEYSELYELVKLYKERGVSWKYTSVLYKNGEKEYLCSTVDGSGNVIKIYKRNNPQFLSINQVAKKENITAKEVYYKYYSKIFQTAMPQSSIRPRVMEEVNKRNIEHDFFSIEYIPKTGKNKGSVYEQFYKGNSFRLLAWLKDVVELKGNDLCKKDLLGTYWDYVKDTKNLSKEGQVILNNGKKPELLLKNIIECSTEENDIVLDMFLGSGTTCAVAHKMNRQFIGIEQLDYAKNDSIVRLKNVISGEQSGISANVNWQGGGSFIYCELAKANQEYIEKIQKSKDTKALLKLWETMQDKAFISYKVDIKEINENVCEFEELPLKDQKRFLIEVLDKNMLYVPYSEIDDTDYNISDEDKVLNHKFYGGKA
ncbi:MAG: DNA methyltransferase, partial [bacterium]